jgi:Flp pilus assembly pilin Flp
MGSMPRCLRQFRANDRGQDLTEWALLLFFVSVAALCLFLITGTSFVGIWSVSNSQVVAASAVAAS